MIRTILTASAMIVGLSIGHAHASCAYNGTIYQPGVMLCFDTWLQECTRAGNWQSVGACRATDPALDRAQTTDPAKDRMFSMLDRYRSGRAIPILIK